MFKIYMKNRVVSINIVVYQIVICFGGIPILKLIKGNWFRGIKILGYNSKKLKEEFSNKEENVIKEGYLQADEETFKEIFGISSDSFLRK